MILPSCDVKVVCLGYNTYEGNALSDTYVTAGDVLHTHTVSIRFHYEPIEYRSKVSCFRIAFQQPDIGLPVTSARYKCPHMCESTRLDSVLSQISAFLNNHPNEIIIVYFNELYYMSDAKD